jgi:hypothetical protein
MTPDEQVNMMRRCAEEIRMLRSRIDELEPKAEAYTALVRLIGLLPQPPRAYAEDMVWRLEKEIDTIERLRKPMEETQSD